MSQTAGGRDRGRGWRDSTCRCAANTDLGSCIISTLFHYSSFSSSPSRSSLPPSLPLSFTGLPQHHSKCRRVCKRLHHLLLQGAPSVSLSIPPSSLIPLLPPSPLLLPPPPPSSSPLLPPPPPSSSPPPPPSSPLLPRPTASGSCSRAAAG